MGTDIHMYVEEAKKMGKWYKIGNIFSNEFNNESDEPYVGRNYTLFAYLANVRNGFGFAGVDTGDPIPVIEEPRGLPKKLSDGIKERYDEWYPDAHSSSYFTIRELDYAKEKAREIYFNKRGVVFSRGYIDYLKYGKPQTFSGNVMGGRIQHVSNEEMEEALKEGYSKNYVTQVEWVENLYDKTKDFWEDSFKQIKNKIGIKNTRIVFWFDN